MKFVEKLNTYYRSYLAHKQESRLIGEFAMNIEDLREMQADFEGTRQDLKRTFSSVEKLRRQFVSQFSPSRLRVMSIEEYVVGHQMHNTFCYWLETTLMELGKIKGGSPADKKFGIYFGKTINDSAQKYRYLLKFGNSKEEAYNNVRNEIISLLEAGKQNAIDIIIDNKLSPMFKGKILSTYYPDRYLGVFSDKHLDYFLERTGLMSDETVQLDQVEKREALLKFKESDSVMKTWSVFEFYRFLYEKFGRPVQSTEKVAKDLKGYIESQFPSINNVDPEFIDLSTEQIPDGKKTRKSSGSGKGDYEKQSRANKKLGYRGEQIVLKAEREVLISLGRKDLANQIDHIASKDDYAGYDILSFDESGEEKHIEVKATKGKTNNASFIISASEKRTAEELDNYFIYIVFEAHTVSPKIFKLERPFSLPKEKIRLTPQNYRVQLNLK